MVYDHVLHMDSLLDIISTPLCFTRLSLFSNLAKVQSQSFHAVAVMLMKHSYQAHLLNPFSRWAFLGKLAWILGVHGQLWAWTSESKYHATKGSPPFRRTHNTIFGGTMPCTLQMAFWKPILVYQFKKWGLPMENAIVDTKPQHVHIFVFTLDVRVCIFVKRRKSLYRYVFVYICSQWFFFRTSKPSQKNPKQREESRISTSYPAWN